MLSLHWHEDAPHDSSCLDLEPLMIVLCGACRITKRWGRGTRGPIQAAWAPTRPRLS